MSGFDEVMAVIQGQSKPRGGVNYDKPIGPPAPQRNPIEQYIKPPDQRAKETLKVKPAKTPKQVVEEVKSRNYKSAGVKSAAQLSAKTPGTHVYEVNRARKQLGIKEGSDKDRALKAILLDRGTDGKVSAEEYKKVVSMMRDGSYAREYQRLQDRNRNSRARKSGADKSLPFTEEALKSAVAQNLTAVEGKDGKPIEMMRALQMWQSAGLSNAPVEAETQEEQDLRLRGDAPSFEGKYDRMTKEEQEADLEKNVRGTAKWIGSIVPESARNNAFGKVLGAIADFGGELAVSPADAVMNFGRASDPDRKPSERILAGAMVAVDALPVVADKIIGAAWKGAKAFKNEVKAVRAAGKLTDAEFNALISAPDNVLESVAKASKRAEELGSKQPVDDAVEAFRRKMQAIPDEPPVENPIGRELKIRQPENVGGDVGAEFRQAPQRSTQPDFADPRIGQLARGAQPDVPQYNKDVVLPDQAKDAPQTTTSTKKEPWEMTQAERIEYERGRWKGDEKSFESYADSFLVGDNAGSGGRSDHAAEVSAAFKEGKPVPQEVLDEYPRTIAQDKFRATQEMPQEPVRGNLLDDEPQFMSDAVERAKARKAARAAKRAQEEVEGIKKATSGGFSDEDFLDLVDDVIIKFGEAGQWVEANVKAFLKERGAEGQYAKIKEAAELDSQNPEEFLRQYEQPNTQGPKQATGLANQVQEREALAGIIDEVEPVKGKSAEDWQRIGQQKVDEGASYESLAERIASGEVELTGERVGILTEGKRRLMQNVEEARRALADDPTNKGRAERLAEARETLQTFVENVQQGKGRWSDVGRALQAGTTVDEGDFASVIARMEERGKSVDPKLSKRLESETAKVAERDARIVELEKQLKEAETQTVLTTARRGPRIQKEVLRQNITSNLERLKAERAKSSVRQSSTRGAAAPLVTKEEALIIKEIALDFVRLGTEELKDVVAAVKQAVKDALGVDYDDQQIIDAIATVQPRTRTELAKNLQELRTQAKSLSTPTKEKRAAAKAAKKARAEERKSAEVAKRYERMAKEAAAKAAKESRDDMRSKMQAEAKRLADEAAAKAKRQRELDEAARKLERANERELKKLSDVQAQINDLQKQLETGQFREPTKREVQVRKDLEDLRAERDIYANRVRRIMRDHDQTWWQRNIKGVADTVRTTVLGSDIGILTRQGMYSWARPRTAIKAVGKAAKAAFNEKEAVKAQRLIDTRRLADGRSAAVVRKNAGLSLSDRLTDPEELSFSRLLQKIPGIGDKIGGSLDRFQHVFINQVRADVFDMAAEKGFNEAELRARARFINNATGRGNVKRVPELLQNVMISPRYEASRWSMIAEYFRNPVEALSNRGARENLKDLGANAATIFSLFKVAELAGYEVNYDMSSSDFLKMRKGDEVWDPTAGIATRVKDAIRLGVYAINPDYRDNAFKQLGGMVTKTASPAITAPGSFVVGKIQQARGEEEILDLRGFQVEEERQGWIAFAPLIAQSFAETLKAEGPVQASEAAFKEFIGQSVNRYPEAQSTPLENLRKEDSKRALESRLRKVVNEKLPKAEIRKEVESADFLSETRREFLIDVLDGKKGIDDDKKTQDLDDRINGSSKEERRDLIQEVRKAKYLSDRQKDYRIKKLRKMLESS